MVADDSVLVREGLARLLAEAGFEVVATAADPDELLREVGRVHTDVASTDIRMPPTHVDEGLLAAAEIRRLHPGVGVLVLSQYLDSSYAMRLLEDYPGPRRLPAQGACLRHRRARRRNPAHRRGRVRHRPDDRGPADEPRARRGAACDVEPDGGDHPHPDRRGRSDEAIAQQLGVGTDAYERELRDVLAKLGLSGTRNDLRRAVAVLGYLSSTA